MRRTIITGLVGRAAAVDRSASGRCKRRGHPYMKVASAVRAKRGASMCGNVAVALRYVNVAEAERAFVGVARPLGK